MIRVVLTVLLAVALLGVSLPVLEDARAETTAERIGTEAERIERAASGLTADSVAVDDPTLAARTSLVVPTPSGLGAAPIAELALVNLDDERIDGRDRPGSRADGSDRTGPVFDRTDRVVSDEHGRERAADADVALTYRFRGKSVRILPIPNPTGTTDLVVVDGPIQLENAGESRIELRFVDGEKRSTVRIARTG